MAIKYISPRISTTKRKRKFPRAPTPPPTRIHLPKNHYSRQANKRQTQFLIKEQLEE